MNKRWQETELFGETVREVGVLIGVFIPLDALFQTPRPAAFLIVNGIALGLSFATAGIILESMGRRRQ